MHHLHRTLLATLLAASSGLSLAQYGGAPAEEPKPTPAAAVAASAPAPAAAPAVAASDAASAATPAASSASAAAADPEAPPDMDPSDPVMQAAFKKGKATLSKFMPIALKNTDPKLIVFAVKVGFHDGDKTEHMWVTPFKAEGKKFSGRLNDLPRKVGNLKHEQQVTFAKADIVDWMFYNTEFQHMFGNYTTCARLTLAKQKDVEEVKRIFGLDCKDNDLRVLK